MIYRGFIGPSAQLQSAIADAERSMNLYVERVQSQAAPTSSQLLSIAGQTPLYETTSVGTRAIWSQASRDFAVVGGDLWELFSDGTKTNRSASFGTMAQDTNPATISYNNNILTLGITSGGNWYNYDLSANVLTQVAALNGKATQGAYKDGYYLCFDKNANSVYVSNLNDGTTWVTGISFFQRSIASDPIMAMLVVNPIVYLIGEQTSEGWYDEGSNAQQPFAPVLSSFMTVGTSASFAVGNHGDLKVWLARTQDGQDIIVSTRGYDPQPISTYPVSQALAQFRRNATLNDAEIMVYEENGHPFAVFNFWSAKSSWAVDLNTGEWHERGTWNSAQTSFDAWHPRVHGYSSFGTHLVGERATGVISELTTDVATEADGSGIRRIRTGPPIWAPANKRITCDRFQVQMDVGVGQGTGQGQNPMIGMRMSKDGHTYGPRRYRAMGTIGQYSTKVFWTRNGSSEKLLMPELVVSDPVPVRMSAAEIFGDNLYGYERAA